MSKHHIVKQGECITSIADQYGFFWQTIWDDKENIALRTKRQNPNVLFPGDVVCIPEKYPKWEAGTTEKRHRFYRVGVPAILRLRFMLDGLTRANEPYRISIDRGGFLQGSLKGDGTLELAIPCSARVAQVWVGKTGEEEGFQFALGSVNPISEISGIQQRLINLGYACPTEKIMGDGTMAAINAFQKDKGLPATGQLDDATRQAILDAHGS